MLIPSNPPGIPRRRGASDFSNFREKKIITRASSRIRTNPETRVGSFRFRKNLELELRPASFEKYKSSLSRGHHNLFFSDTTLFCRFVKLVFRCPESFFEKILRMTRFVVMGMSLPGALFLEKHESSFLGKTRFSCLLMLPCGRPRSRKNHVFLYLFNFLHVARLLY